MIIAFRCAAHGICTPPWLPVPLMRTIVSSILKYLRFLLEWKILGLSRFVSFRALESF